MSAVPGRIFEEIFPFIIYLRLRSNVLYELATLAAGDLPEGPVLVAIRAYSGAAPTDLEEGLASEQKRGGALDEKTFKHATSFATALTVASVATTAITQFLPDMGWKIAVIVFSIPSIIYVTAGGLLGFAAARTLPMFGTGMNFAIENKNSSPAMKPFVIARALACQERVNQVRVARNEVAFMSIRNGFLCTIVALSIALFGAIQPANKNSLIERKVWPASSHQTKLEAQEAVLYHHRFGPST